MQKYIIFIIFIISTILSCSTFNHTKVDFVYNHEKFDIRGLWPMYYDEPNVIFDFKDNNIVVTVTCSPFSVPTDEGKFKLFFQQIHTAKVLPNCCEVFLCYIHSAKLLSSLLLL